MLIRFLPLRFLLDRASPSKVHVDKVSPSKVPVVEVSNDLIVEASASAPVSSQNETSCARSLRG